MSTGYKIQDQEALHYLTFQVVNWIDIFTRKVYRDIIIDSLKYCQENKGLELYGYVIMSNHIHVLIRASNNNLSDIIRDFKTHTSKIIIHEIQEGRESRKEWLLNQFSFAATKHKRNINYQFWTHENHAEIIFSNKFIWQKLEYIHNNPVRNGIVSKPEDYLYSSAKNYADDVCLLIDVILLTLPLKTI
jgi:REP element-mobilizing transposase RayT